MFGNKNKNKEPEVVVETESIPAEFYGGINPTVKFKTTEKEVEFKKPTVLTVPEKKAFDKVAAVGGGSKLHVANLLTSPKFLLLSAGGLLIVFGAVGGIYYWQQSRANQPVVVIPNNIIIPAVVEEQLVEPVVDLGTVAEVTTTVVVEEVKTSIFDVPPTYPSLTLGKSNDTDNDGLTDVAEELFSTDLGAPDSDKDKYSDSHELFNLYNPIGKEPRKLIDSGLVLDFANPVFAYKIYYPKTWAVGNVDVNYRDVLFSTLTGESVEVRAIEKTSPDGSFADWFAQWAPTEKISDLKEFVTVFGDKGWQRSDGLVYYFETPRRVYVLVYHVTDSQVVNFEIVIKMMARSFRLSLTDEILPALVVEENGSETPVVPAVTTPIEPTVIENNLTTSSVTSSI